MEYDSSRRRIMADRLGDLPDCLLYDVLSRLGSRQVVQTSVLSRRWRHLWRDVRCVDLDQQEFELDRWVSFEAFADHMLLRLRSAEETPQRLDAFRLHLGAFHLDPAAYHNSAGRRNSWIRRGLECFPSEVDIRACSVVHVSSVTWPDMNMNTAGRCLTRLRLLHVFLPSGFGHRIGEQCPVIEDLHLEYCVSPDELRGIASPTLRSLAVIFHNRFSSADELVVTAPRLASLHLAFQNDDGLGRAAAHGGEDALGSLVAASICVSETIYYHDSESTKQLRNFWSSIRSFLGRAPNLINLHLKGFNTTAFLDVQFPEFPTFRRLRTLLLQNCDVIGANFEALTTILDNAPSLKKLGLHVCMRSVEQLSFSQLRRSTAATSLVCKELKSVEIKHGNKLQLLHFLSQIQSAEKFIDSIESNI